MEFKAGKCSHFLTPCKLRLISSCVFSQVIWYFCSIQYLAYKIKLSITRGGRKLLFDVQRADKMTGRDKRLLWLSSVIKRSKNCPQIICFDQGISPLRNVAGRMTNKQKCFWERSLYSLKPQTYCETSTRAEGSVFQEKVKLQSAFPENNTASSFLTEKSRQIDSHGTLL